MHPGPIAYPNGSHPTRHVTARRAGLDRPLATLALTALVLGLSFVVGCKGPAERAAAHLERAQELLEEPARLEEIRESSLELRNAVTLDPDNVEANALLGRTLLRLGVATEALQYLEDAHRLAPDDAEITVDLARTLLFTDPQRAEDIARQALEADSNSVTARLVLAEARAIDGDYAGAHARVDEAAALAPELPDVEYTRARVQETKLRTLRLKPGRTIFRPQDFQATVDAYDAYVEKGGKNASTALLAKAKLFAGWPGHGRQAIESFKAAADAAEHDPAAQTNVLESMARFTRTLGDDEARLYALERITRLSPYRIDQWEVRSRVARSLGKPVWPILEEMLEKVGDDARAHVVYARALRDDQGLTAAVEHLRARIDAGDEAPVLLAQMVQLQTQGGRPKDGARTLQELQSKHPDDIQTRLLVARRAMIAGDLTEARQAIEQIALDTGSPEALRVLSRVQERQGHVDAALATIEQLIEAGDEFDGSLWSRKAELLRDLGRPEEALAALQRLDWGDELTPQQQLLRARCEYDLGRRAVARQRLNDLLLQPDAPIEAALELHARERGHRASIPRIREALLDAQRRAPGSYELLEALVDLDLSTGARKVAARRVSTAIDQRPRDPRLYALRARLMLALGSPKAARADAERALALTPGRGDDALEVLIALAEGSSDPDSVIATLESQNTSGQLPRHRMVILGRLLARQGRLPEALAIFEEALAAGARFTTLKSDTAHLILATHGDLDRAEMLAREAVATPGDQVVAADVLGLVYMARGLHDAAMYQFAFAVEHADPPNPNYLLHLGQAFEGMRRIESARDAYARALEIDPQHVDSRAALGALGADAAAPRTDPS